MSRNGIVVFALFWMPSLASGDDEAKARFQNEYPEAAKKLEQRFSQVKGSGVLTDSRVKATHPLSRQVAKFAADHEHEKVKLERVIPGAGKAQKLEIVYCAGPGTLFYLTRAPGAKEFTVEGINANGADKAAYNTLFRRFLRANYAITGVPVTVLMNRPGYRLQDAEKIVKDGRSLMRVVFDFDSNGSKNMVTAVFDPSAGWPLVSSEYRMARKARQKTESSNTKPSWLTVAADVEYGEPLDGYAMPRRVIFHEPDHETLTCEFLGWSFKPTPIEEFGMAYFNMPDLVSSANQPKYTLPYWLAAATSIALVLGIAFWRIGRRSAIS